MMAACIPTLRVLLRDVKQSSDRDDSGSPPAGTLNVSFTSVVRGRLTRSHRVLHEIDVTKDDGSGEYHGDGGEGQKWQADFPH